MRRRSVIIAVVFVGALLVGAIVAVTVFSALSAPRATLTQPIWTLTKLVVDGQEQALPATRPATLHFGARDSHVTGSRGCNTFRASYLLKGNQVQFGGLSSTAIGCFDAVVTRQESHFLQALLRVQTYEIAGTTLTLRGDGDQVQLTFRAS
jgi:heat shock protein HslJ